MTHWKLMHDSTHLYHFHLQGRDVTITIDRVVKGKLKGDKGRETTKPMIYIKGRPELPLALCKTNCKTIAGLYGPMVEDWVGKRITLYPTQTDFGGEKVDCIRVRNKVPGAAVQDTPPEPVPSSEESADAPL